MGFKDGGGTNIGDAMRRATIFMIRLKHQIQVTYFITTLCMNGNQHGLERWRWLLL